MPLNPLCMWNAVKIINMAGGDIADGTSTRLVPYFFIWKLNTERIDQREYSWCNNHTGKLLTFSFCSCSKEILNFICFGHNVAIAMQISYVVMFAYITLMLANFPRHRSVLSILVSTKVLNSSFNIVFSFLYFLFFD